MPIAHSAGCPGSTLGVWASRASRRGGDECDGRFRHTEPSVLHLVARLGPAPRVHLSKLNPPAGSRTGDSGRFRARWPRYALVGLVRVSSNGEHAGTEQDREGSQARSIRWRDSPPKMGTPGGSPHIQIRLPPPAIRISMDHEDLLTGSVTRDQAQITRCARDPWRGGRSRR